MMDVVRASIFVDGGARVSDLEAVEEGARIFQELMLAFPDRLELPHNLANALVAVADLESSASSGLVSRYSRYSPRSAKSVCSLPPANTKLRARCFVSLPNKPG